METLGAQGRSYQIGVVWEAEIGLICGFGPSWEEWAQSRSRGIAVFGVGENIWVLGL